jgi:hypothetical protein
MIYDFIIVNKILPIDLLKVIRLKYSYEYTKNMIIYKLPLIMRCFVLLLGTSLLVLLRFNIMEFSTPIFKPVDNPASFLDNILLRIINYNYIYFLNLWLLLCPEWLCFDWSMGCVPVIDGADLRICLVFLLWFIIVAYLVIIFSEKDYHLTRYILFIIHI